MKSGTNPARQGKLMAFRALALFLATLMAACVVELSLDWRAARIRKSEDLEQGLVRPDAMLGWSLTPNWSGRHRSFDFDVRYSINQAGFRGDSNTPGSDAGNVWAVVGDSFTFGLGVNDRETFVHLLQGRAAGSRRFVNFAVPGYSTDQELLLIEQKLLESSPQAVLLVVYLANDLFDNLRPSPLQVNAAKPYFELEGEELVLKNQPVPTDHSQNVNPVAGLAVTVLGEDRARGLRYRLEDRSELFRLLSQGLFKTPDLSGEFETRFAPALDLFSRLIARIDAPCRQRNIQFVVALMPGGSFVDKPRSLSAQYQEFLRARVRRNLDARKIDVIDLASLLRQRRVSKQGRWFYPNDGHLTSEGHEVVAGILASELALRPDRARRKHPDQ